MDPDSSPKRLIAAAALGTCLLAVPAWAADGAAPLREPAGPFGYAALAVLAMAWSAFLTFAQTAVAAVSGITEEGEDLRHGASAQSLALVEQRCSAGSLLLLILAAMFAARAGQRLLPGQIGLGSGIGIGFALAAHVLLVEVASRNLALLNPRLAYAVARIPARILSAPFHLLVLPYAAIGLFDRSGHNAAGLTDMHLRLLPTVSGIEKVMDEEAVDMIDSVKEFVQTTGEKIMTPRTEIEGVEDTTPAADIYERLRASRFSRLLVYSGSMDHIVGTLLAKEVLLHRPPDPLKLLRKPIFASEKARAPELLQAIRSNRSHLLVLLDEYGGVAGIVTLHDLFEILIGDIEEMADDEEHWILREGDGHYTVDGRVEVWELNESIGTDLDEDAARTVGGYVFNTIGRVPAVGESAEIGGVRFEVLEMDEKRIGRLRVDVRHAARDAAGGEA